MTDTTERLRTVQGKIARAETEAGRQAGSVTLVAASKTFSAGDIRPVIKAGQRVFGENRVQEAQAKWPGLKAEQPGICLHLIGPLQSNKAKEAVALFDVIETVDREKIATALAAEMEKQGRSPKLFVQLEKLAREAGVAKLSMGMSADYETAIAFGATHVRVGSAIFGAR